MIAVVHGAKSFYNNPDELDSPSELERAQISHSTLPVFPIPECPQYSESEELDESTPSSLYVPEGYFTLDDDEEVDEEDDPNHYREVTVLKESLGVSPVRWEDFCRHLSTLVLDSLEEQGVTIEELAAVIDIPEDYLREYLDPSSRSVIASMFLNIADELKIGNYTLFPRLTAAQFEHAYQFLMVALARVEAYSITHLMQYKPGKEFESYFYKRFNQAFDLFCSQKELSRDEGIDYMIDEHQEEFTSFSLHDFFEAIDNKKLPSLIRESGDVWLDFDDLCQVLRIDMATFIPIKQLSLAEIFELKVRYDSGAAMQESSSVESDDYESEDFEHVEEYTPQLSLEDQDTLASMNGEYQPAEEFYAEDEQQTQARKFLQDQLSTHICGLITGDLPWLTESQDDD